MKHLFKIIIFTSSSLLATSCSNVKEEKLENETEIKTTGEETASENEFISGTITAIQQGKDGYTAKLKTAPGPVYLVTISRSNLSDPASFRTVEIGDSLSVKGDTLLIENQNHITVREMK